MSFELVNGYVCRTCADVDYAKRGIDPAHPHDKAGSAHHGGGVGRSSLSTSGAAAATTGVPGAEDGSASSGDATGQPLPDGDRGTLVNLLV